MDGIKFLETCNGTIFDMCYTFYMDYLKNESDEKKSIDLFKHLISRDIISDMTHDLDSVENRDKYIDDFYSIAKVVNKYVDNLAKKDESEEFFYNDLWHFVFDNTLFSKDSDKVGALAGLVINEQIPYFQLSNPTSFEEDEFKELYKKCLPQILKGKYIVNKAYDNQLESASHFIKVLNEIGDDKEKILVLANAFFEYEKKINGLIDALQETEEEQTTE